jgi:hypothetical protein
MGTPWRSAVFLCSLLFATPQLQQLHAKSVASLFNLAVVGDCAVNRSDIELRCLNQRPVCGGYTEAAGHV